MKNRIFNSAILMLLAYFTIHLLRVGIQFVFANAIKLDKVEMYFFYVVYDLPGLNWWTRFKVILISGSGLFLTFFILILSIIIFLGLSRKKFKLNVFYNWVIIIASAFIISDIVSAPFFRRLTHVFSLLRWLNFEDSGGGMYVIAIMNLPFIPIVSYYTNKSFLKMSNTSKWIKTRSSRLKFYLKVSFIPFIILSITISIMVYFVFDYTLKESLVNEGMKLLIIFLILFFGAIFTYNKNFISIQKSNTFHEVNISFNFLVIVAIVAIYILLWFNLF